ncbi:MAG TPA: TetR family transcriptional regulator [Acidimicrobiales bacterium]
MPSENAATSVPIDRRTRKREARRHHLLDLAAELVEQGGVEAVTMAALAEAADYAPASLYTYFGSRSALLAALQERALVTLGRVADDQLAAWDAALALADVPSPAVAALARLWAFSELLLTAPEHHPREFRLQQQLLVTPGSEDSADAAAVVPTAMGVLDVPRRLLAAAVESGALHAAAPAVDPLGHEVDGAVARTFAWVVALNGALLADGLTTGLPVTGAMLGAALTDALLRGWGAPPAALDAARTLAATWPGPAVSEGSRS